MYNAKQKRNFIMYYIGKQKPKRKEFLNSLQLDLYIHRSRNMTIHHIICYTLD